MSFISLVVLMPVLALISFGGILMIHEWYLDKNGIQDAEWYQITDTDHSKS